MQALHGGALVSFVHRYCLSIAGSGIGTVVMSSESAQSADLL